WADYQRLQEAGISIPQTTARPPVAAPRLPYILKWTYGFGGRHTFFISDQKRAATVAARYPAGELLLQEYVPAEFEYKVITIGYQALPVILKFALHPKTRRPDFKRYWVLKENAAVTALAQRAAKELGRELAKTDIMEAAGRLYVLEVNRFPGLHSFEALTGYNVAEKFMDYLLKKGMADNLHNS
ncbi:MAG TPA: ATP-grasp domain-containing protein, partial [Patescibacteria group bacterium]|nr:ATP-grasp domain-containing protein [Patescibacteria group bacterium]